MRQLHHSLPPRAAVRKPALILAALACVALTGCEDAPRKNPFDPPKDAPVPTPAASATAKKEVAPELEIDTVSTKVGFERALLQNPEGRARLAQLLGDAKKWIDGQEVRVLVDR